MRRQLLPALRLLLVMTAVCGLAYPLLVTGIAQAVFSHQADGSLIRRGGTVVGSELLGQQFTRPEYFHSRPSAASYDAQASGGSNLGPSNSKLWRDVSKRAAAYRRENGLAPGAEVPVDAVTGSFSGLDPHISVANARLQAGRVAERRSLSRRRVLRLVDEHTTDRTFGFLGEKVVNVLQLNLALDRLGP